MDERSGFLWSGAGHALARNATILRAIGLVAFVCLSIVFSTAGIYLRSWALQWEIQQLKDYILISNQPDSACSGSTAEEWIYGPLEAFRGCDARQREDFTRSDKEIFDQCILTHEYGRQKRCQRGKEVHIHVFNVTNPQDVVSGLTPRMVEVGRQGDGGPFIFYEDCKTFDTEFGATETHFSEHCQYTYKYVSTETADLQQEVVTVNVGLMEAIGNSIGQIDYVVPTVWGTLALDEMNATTTTAEDYIRGQLLSFSWPNNFGTHFLNEFSPKAHLAGARAMDNAWRLFELVRDAQTESCLINGTQYDRNQCVSMANTLAIFARRYYESFQTYKISPYGLRYREGAGLFVKARIGDLLGYYTGYDDPLSSYHYPRKVSWNVVRSQTQAEVRSSVLSGAADTQIGVMNSGPIGRSSLVTNALEDLGSYSRFQGRAIITEFDWQGCRPQSVGGGVVVPPEGPFPPQCNGGIPQTVYGSRGALVKPRVWSLQPDVVDMDHVYIFSRMLMRPLKYSLVEDVELDASDGDVVQAKRFELTSTGLREARMAFHCGDVYRDMAVAGVLNRGSDCDMHEGMFDIAALHHQIPYEWSLPHFYLVSATDSTQHPRNNLLGFVTPTGPRYRNMIVVEMESGRVLESTLKEQISIRLYHSEQNYFFTQHRRVTIPLYWKFETKNSTVEEKQLLAGFQRSFRGLNAGFWVCVVLGGVTLVAALMFGMLLYRESSLQAVDEKRKRIQAELASAFPPDQEEDDEAEAGPGRGFH